MSRGSMWRGACPPQAVFSRRRFRKVLLDPPKLEPGCWCGAGKIWIDTEDGEYWLTSRPRCPPPERGYAVEIYRSRDGESYSLVCWITKEELSEVIGRPVHSIEGQQLLRDPLTGKYYLYLSIDVAQENVAGEAGRVFESKWETYLMAADDPAGPWEGVGFALRADRDYDSGEARDCTIDIVDGLYFCVYKARSAGSRVVRPALAISSDGIKWRKLGVLSVEGETHDFLLLYGSILPSSMGPMFVGTKTTHVVKGAALTKEFAAYVIEHRGLRLEEVFVSEWRPMSRYEHPEYPIHTYCSVTYDPLSERWLIAVEAVDPTHSKEPGLNLEVDRLLLYVSDAPRGALA